MNRILRETHKKSNVNLLKARDHYFGKGRRLHLLVVFITYLPVIITFVSYLLKRIDWIDNYRDIYTGVFSALVFVIVTLINRKIDDYLHTSNNYRETYDCIVFDLEPNILTKNEMVDQKECDDKAESIYTSRSHLNKYEMWYGEIFCDKNSRDVICSQMDNVIYTYFIYKEYLIWAILTPLAIILLSFIASFIFADNNWFVLIHIFVASFTIIQTMIENVSNVRTLIKKNKEIMDYVESNSNDIERELDDPVASKQFLRIIQDQIVINREASVFVPKSIRVSYLTGKKNKVYYTKLDELKYHYFGKSFSIPTSSKDIEIWNIKEEKTITLDVIHQRLLEMMKKVKDAFDKEGIKYTLDGGTLIGALRPSYLNGKKDFKDGGFIYWDDDIDIAIPLDNQMLEKAKDAIKKHLGEDEFFVQDYDNDPYYSPRLSNFRIRDKKTLISEKDSLLYDLYQSRGLFIDVYGYHPILKNIKCDSYFRRRYIHPLNKKLAKYESHYEVVKSKKDVNKMNKYLSKYTKLKEKYMKRVDWYLKHANNDEYYCYTPNYIDNFKKPGPYIIKSWLYGENRNAEFEGLSLPIPSQSDKVLEAFYGDWMKPSFVTMNDITDKDGHYQSIANDKNKKLGITIMKHIDHVDITK